MNHSQGLKNVFGSKLCEGLLRSSLHDFGKHEVVCIAVDELVPGIVIETFLTFDEVDNVPLGTNIRFALAGKIEQCGIVPEAARMVHHPSHSGTGPIIAEGYEVSVQIV